MRIAHIVPPQWAGTLPVSDYTMALAHWVLEYPGYAKFVRRWSEYVLMDNGAFELQHLDLDQLNKAAVLAGADEVVLPDDRGSPTGTLKQSWKALGQLATKRVMFVPHGSTTEEWQECLTVWVNKWNDSPWSADYVLSIGVSSLIEKGTTETMPGTKLPLLKAAAHTGYSVHLLGIASVEDFALNVLPAAHALGVRGVDSSLAFALAVKGVLLTPSAEKRRLGDILQYVAITPGARRLTHLNMRILTEWVTHGRSSDVIMTFWIRQEAVRWLAYWAEGFCDLVTTMKACGMPSGKYALLKENGREQYVRPIEHSKDLRSKEQEIEITQDVRKYTSRV